MKFRLCAPFHATSAQKEAAKAILHKFRSGEKDVVLLGVTGSGKTYTMALVIEALQLPTLVIAPNKTLAAQLYQEFREFFPENAVEYFVSYYDYYQPEAYKPQTDTYIEKDFVINEDIDRLRLSTTRSLFERDDVIIVASVSCIYGLGSPDFFYGMHLYLEVNMSLPLEKALQKLIELQYERKSRMLERGTFRLIGDRLEIYPTTEEQIIRVVWDEERIDSINEVDPLTGAVTRHLKRKLLFPRTHYVMPKHDLLKAVGSIEEELEQQIAFFTKQGKTLEAKRIEQRTRYDIEMLLTVGHCRGIENYSRHLDGRKPGEPPATLLDYFRGEFLTLIDESHMTVPQIRGMYRGDRARKLTLIEYGFRLPSALDNRPLTFEEFESKLHKVLYISATPGPYELEKCRHEPVELLVRPTGLLDPIMEVRPTQGQIDDVLHEIQTRIERKERVLISTLTKRMAEDVCEFLVSRGIKAHYLHSEIDTLERVTILRNLRLGVFDVIVGVNLLREGLDLPEVSLVIIFDADKEGYLRSTTALIQMAGRAARNIHGKVILYADTITRAMREALSETHRRRKIQIDYNKKHGITPHSIEKAVREDIYPGESPVVLEATMPYTIDELASASTEDIEKKIEELEQQMWDSAEKLEFEKAIQLREQIKKLKNLLLEL